MCQILNIGDNRPCRNLCSLQLYSFNPVQDFIFVYPIEIIVLEEMIAYHLFIKIVALITGGMSDYPLYCWIIFVFTKIQILLIDAFMFILFSSMAFESIKPTKVLLIEPISLQAL